MNLDTPEWLDNALDDLKQHQDIIWQIRLHILDYIEKNIDNLYKSLQILELCKSDDVLRVNINRLIREYESKLLSYDKQIQVV